MARKFKVELIFEDDNPYPAYKPQFVRSEEDAVIFPRVDRLCHIKGFIFNKIPFLYHINHPLDIGANPRFTKGSMKRVMHGAVEKILNENNLIKN